MTNHVRLQINGKYVEVPEGTSVAAAIERAGVFHFRRSVSGQPRAPLCGMGICMECRVIINGRPFVRTCQALCREGMDIQTDA
jgi:D-hydroxyproline dehydrogenase subunit gamma